MLIVGLVLLTLLLWLVYRTLFIDKKMLELSANLKSDILSLPFVGQSYIFLGDDENHMKAFQKLGSEAIKFGGLTKLRHGNYFIVVVADPRNFDVIFKSCIEKGLLLDNIRFITGNGSLFAPGQIWRPRRKKLAPLFSLKTLHSYMPIFVRQSDVMVDALRKVNNEVISIWNYLTTFTMDTIFETMLGIHLKTQNGLNLEILKAIDDLSQSISKRLVQPWLQIDFIYQFLPNYKDDLRNKKCLYDFIAKSIEMKRKELLEGKDTSEERLTVMEQLILKDYDVSELELIEEAVGLVVAGNDTTGVGTSFTSVLLSVHQDIQDKVYDELQTVFGDSTRPIEVSDLPRLKYLEAVIKETLRLYPPGPVIIKETSSDVQLRLTIPRGCGVLFNIWAVHRNPTIWGKDAEEFKPERFLHGTAHMHPAAFMPFSYGARACLGQQYAMMSMKAVLASLLREFKLLPANDTIKLPLRVKYDIMMRHTDNYMIRIESRTSHLVRSQAIH